MVNRMAAMVLAVAAVVACGNRGSSERRDEVNWDIWVVNVDGTVPQRLTSDPALDLYPKWSPDGTRIAFHSTRHGHTDAGGRTGTGFDAFTMRADGTAVAAILRRPSSEAAFASWSPDGRSVVLSVGEHDSDDLVVVSLPDGLTRRLTGGREQDIVPDWSPDGRRIAFVRTERGGEPTVYTVAADGATLPTPVQGAETPEQFPSWSPDGTQLAVVAERAIVVIDVATLERRTVYAAANVIRDTAWSPDGKHLAFSNGTTRGFDLWTVDVDGTGAHRITSDPADEITPDWSPDGHRLAYSRLATNGIPARVSSQ